MELNISELNYHISRNDTSNNKLVDEVLSITLNTYKNLNERINSIFLKCKYKGNDIEKEALIKKLTLSILKELSDEEYSYGNKELSRLLKNRILKTLPVVLLNEKINSFNSNFFYEPRNSCSFFLLYKYQLAIAKYFVNKKECETFLDYKLLLINNINRSLKSSLVLLSTGDDVHGISILRGTLELLARFRSLNEDNFETYKLHVKLNADLQKAKINREEIDNFNYPELNELINDKHLHGGKLELYLLNSWCKNRNGKIIQSTSDIIKHAFNKEMVSFYDHASEFVHEDYLGVNYNYIFIRKQCKNMITILTEELFLFLNHNLTNFTKYDKSIYLYLKFLHKNIDLKTY